MHHHSANRLRRILIAAGLFLVGLLLKLTDIPVLSFLVFLAAYLCVGYDVIWEAVQGILHKEWLDENFLMAIASVAAMLTGDSSEAAAVMLLFQVGELFQDYAVGKSRRNISALLDILPDRVLVERGGKAVSVRSAEVRVGEIVLVRPGDRAALDGTVISGSSFLNTAAVTGESLPREVHPGEKILSGCINTDAALRMRVDTPFENSTVNRMKRLVKEAAGRKAKTERFIKKFAKYYTPAVVVCAILISLMPIFMADVTSLALWKKWIHMGAVFLVISCPCALVISIPLSFFGGMGAASSCGILVKGSAYLEALADCNTVCFDKTGTLTRGNFEVTSLRPAEGIDRSKLLMLAAYAESGSSHPIARSILRAYGKQPERNRIGFSRTIAGGGVCTELRGKSGTQYIYGGNLTLMKKLRVEPPITHTAGAAVYFALCDTDGGQGRYLGAIEISDQIKQDALRAVDALRELGVAETVLLTGDKREVAEKLASELELDGVYAKLLPEEKVTQIEALRSENGHVVFVGDGINDAPVLAAADVGIAMGALGSDAAIEAADVVLADDKPSQVALSIRIARKTMRVVRQNVILSLSVKAIVMLLNLLTAGDALAGLLPYMAWLAVFADVGVAILAICNAMRTMRFQNK